jgi:hypothetical protein
MGEEPRGDSGHVGLGVARHLVEAIQVGAIGLDGTDEVGEDGGVEMGSKGSTKGLEYRGGRLCSHLDRPARVPVVNTVDDVAKVLEVVRVGEEGRNEVNRIFPSELIDELGLPTISGGTSTESTGISGEGRSEDVTIVLQLVGMAGVANDVVTERTGILSRRARHHTVIPNGLNNGNGGSECVQLTSCRRR